MGGNLASMNWDGFGLEDGQRKKRVTTAANSKPKATMTKRGARIPTTGGHI
jgi:hypothetical protein